MREGVLRCLDEARPWVAVEAGALAHEFDAPGAAVGTLQQCGNLVVVGLPWGGTLPLFGDVFWRSLGQRGMPIARVWEATRASDVGWDGAVAHGTGGKLLEADNDRRLP